jgi:hypothetical protein
VCYKNLSLGQSEQVVVNHQFAFWKKRSKEKKISNMIRNFYCVYACFKFKVQLNFKGGPMWHFGICFISKANLDFFAS